jgi:hypothetical protein
MSELLTIDPVPPSAYPAFQPVTSAVPAMPASWSGVALMHPFSPPQGSDPTPDSPFFQLCVANVAYVAGVYLSAQIAGCSYGSWWYVITPEGTNLSTDKGQTWTLVDMGWSLPSDWFGAANPQATCAGSSPLNWMSGPTVDWWKAPVPIGAGLNAATWMWFDSSSGAPVRMMFGNGPNSPIKGDPTQLAIFQMFSFTYLPVFSEVADPSPPESWSQPTFPGFFVGNPGGYLNFTWNSSFGMTAFMTPVNEKYNPLPTRVLYEWKSDTDYRVTADRSQNTKMVYSYNPGIVEMELALLTGPPPQGVPAPPDSGSSFLTTYYQLSKLAPSCVGPSGGFDFPQEPPDWVSIPAVEAAIQATIVDNPVLCPGQTITIFSVLFPPAPPNPPAPSNYPVSTYLWTWYSPTDARGLSSRPVTFMQSQSGVGVGTSLALADYFYYQAFPTPIPADNFQIPPCCGLQTRKFGLRRSLP